MKTTTNATLPPSYSVDDPEAYARNMLRLALEGGRLYSNLLARAGAQTPALDELGQAGRVMGDVYTHMMESPQKLVEAQAALLTDFAGLWTGTLRKLFGEDAEPVIEPASGDKRFSDPEWSSNPYFDFWKQAYLLTSRWSETLLAGTEGLDPQTRRTAEFYTRLMTSALSPSNNPLTNPEVVRETFKSNGSNLVEGMRQFSADLEKSGDMLTISQTDTSAFEVGRNLAMTPGKVVFENDLIQLIQYAPATDRVREVPLLIVPPWINKFYILDLTAQKSFVKYAVEQGFTVFLISWVNPDARLAHKSFEDYVSEGLLTAADAVARETGVAKCSVLGYCIGGTLLGTTLAYLAARNEQRFASATFLTTQFDFTLAGDLTIFTNDAVLSGLEAIMAERGYLDSSRIASVFNMMRPQDLIWPYVVNNYLLGRKPPAFDILYWNQDSTRMPAANHAFYLRQFYSDNRLAKGELVLDKLDTAPTASDAPGRDAPDPDASPEDHIVFYLRETRGRKELPAVAMSLDTIRLNLKKVRLPIYELATKEDHIAPAASVFKGARLFDGNVTFVLAGSGHIAGVINPPGKPKYQYWTGAPVETATFEDWVASAIEHPGSWWPHWANWLAEQSGMWVDSRTPGARLGIVEDAPGRYVKSTT